ncbi:MAG: hypothetical protein ACJ703_03065 [Nitrososphaera sp.]
MAAVPNVFDNNNNSRQKIEANNNNNGDNNTNNNEIIKINHSTFTKKIKLSTVVTALLIATLLIPTSAISIPVYGQQQQNTLKVITQVVCPQGYTCPSASDFTMRFFVALDPKPSSFNGNSSGVDVTLGDGNYDATSFSYPDLPQGLVLYPGHSPHCTGTISGGQTKTCIVLMALSSNVDTDGDRIPDSWETNGIPYNGTDGVLHYYKLSGANPNHKNLYVEVDYMQYHNPYSDALEDVKKAFTDAPVSNPAGTTGISLQTDVNEQIPHQDIITMDGLLDSIKPEWFGTATERKDSNHDAMLAAKSLVYHYGLFAHEMPGGITGQANTPGMNFILSLADPQFTGPGHSVGSKTEQAFDFMHELGHNLGLRHGGGDAVNCKPNYLSVMNYYFSMGQYVANEDQHIVAMKMRKKKEQSNEPDYDEDENQLEEKQEEEAEEITTTHNQVF